MADRRRDLSDRGLGIVGSGVCGWGFMAGGSSAVNQRFCSGIWNVHHLGSCF